jgi:PTH1 family peptidyl-tRNA hydrolase
MKAVFGLGNPGETYAETRHNVGRMVASSWAKDAGIAIKGRKFLARTGTGAVDGEQIIVALPQTYMNLSGRSVAAITRFFKLSPADVVVISDDMDLDFGRIRIRPKGGSGGHRGVQSIIDELDADGFIHLRIGIGRPTDEQDDPVDFVLLPFSREELEALPDIIERARGALWAVIRDGVVAAMNEFNG